MLWLASFLSAAWALFCGQAGKPRGQAALTGQAWHLMWRWATVPQGSELEPSLSQFASLVESFYDDPHPDTAALIGLVEMGLLGNTSASIQVFVEHVQSSALSSAFLSHLASIGTPDLSNAARFIRASSADAVSTWNVVIAKNLMSRLGPPSLFHPLDLSTTLSMHALMLAASSAAEHESVAGLQWPTLLAAGIFRSDNEENGPSADLTLARPWRSIDETPCVLAGLVGRVSSAVIDSSFNASLQSVEHFTSAEVSQAAGLLQSGGVGAESGAALRRAFRVTGEPSLLVAAARYHSDVHAAYALWLLEGQSPRSRWLDILIRRQSDLLPDQQAELHSVLDGFEAPRAGATGSADAMSSSQMLREAARVGPGEAAQVWTARAAERGHPIGQFNVAAQKLAEAAGTSIQDGGVPRQEARENTIARDPEILEGNASVNQARQLISDANPRVELTGNDSSFINATRQNDTEPPKGEQLLVTENVTDSIPTYTATRPTRFLQDMETSDIFQEVEDLGLQGTRNTYPGYLQDMDPFHATTQRDEFPVEAQVPLERSPQVPKNSARIPRASRVAPPQETSDSCNTTEAGAAFRSFQRAAVSASWHVKVLKLWAMKARGSAGRLVAGLLSDFGVDGAAALAAELWLEEQSTQVGTGAAAVTASEAAPSGPQMCLLRGALTLRGFASPEKAVELFMKLEHGPRGKSVLFVDLSSNATVFSFRLRDFSHKGEKAVSFDIVSDEASTSGLTVLVALETPIPVSVLWDPRKGKAPANARHAQKVTLLGRNCSVFDIVGRHGMKWTLTASLAEPLPVMGDGQSASHVGTAPATQELLCWVPPEAVVATVKGSSRVCTCYSPTPCRVYHSGECIRKAESSFTGEKLLICPSSPPLTSEDCEPQPTYLPDNSVCAYHFLRRAVFHDGDTNAALQLSLMESDPEAQLFWAEWAEKGGNERARIRALSLREQGLTATQGLWEVAMDPDVSRGARVAAAALAAWNSGVWLFEDILGFSTRNIYSVGV